jgi:hypothetical protein
MLKNLQNQQMLDQGRDPIRLIQNRYLDLYRKLMNRLIHLILLWLNLDRDQYHQGHLIQFQGLFR